MKEFKENTSDRGYEMHCYARNNNATYIITSARGHDKVNDYRDKYGDWPHSRWYHKHFSFQRDIIAMIKRYDESGENATPTIVKA